MYKRGIHREIYHIGNDQEVSIAELVRLTGQATGIELIPRPGPAAAGGAPRRCPDLSKMRALAYRPRTDLEDGLRLTANWYRDNGARMPENALM